MATPRKRDVPERPFLTVREFADLAGVSTTTAMRWINAGQVRVLDLDGATRIPRAEIDRLTREAIVRTG